MKTYDLYIQRSLKIVIVVVMILLLAFSALLFSGALVNKKGQGPPWFMGLFFLAVAGFNGYYWVLRVPHRIETGDDGTVEFISRTGRRKVSARDIRSIVPAQSQVGWLVVRTDGAKVLLLNQFDGFHEFIVWLRTKNPSVELRGC